MPPQNAQTSRTREVKACTACARAKCKCEIETGDAACKRCERLGKLCQNQEPGAHKHKRVPNGQVRRADILRLESKFDSVTQLLAPTAHSSRSPSRNPSPTFEPSTSHAAESSLPDRVEAYRLLDVYRTCMAPLFPFVVISPFISPEELRLTKPILYSAIMMVACQSDVARQISIAREIRQAISEAMFVRNEKSLALLEGILVFLAWNHMHIGLGSQLFNLLHLSQALVTELELNQELHSHSRCGAGAFSEILRDRTASPQRTLEERRVFLGLYWLCSIINNCFKEMQCLRYTPYMDRCCKVLEETKECLNDAYLVKIVRLQQEADRISAILYEGDLDEVSGMSSALAMTISSLEKEVVELTPPILLDGPQASLLQMAQQTLSLHFYKVALNPHLFAPSPTSSNPSTHATLLRPHLLTSCHAAITTLLNTFFLLPPALIISMPYTTWGQLGHAIFILSRFADVRTSFDAAYLPPGGLQDHKHVCVQLAARLEEVVAWGGGESPRSFLPEVITYMVGKLRQMGDGAGTGPAEDVSEGVNGVGRMDGDDGALLGDELTGGMLIDFFDFGQGW